MNKKLKEVGSFEITSYGMEDGNIVITKVKALYTEGKYMKFAKLDKVLKYLPLFPVRFKSQKL